MRFLFSLLMISLFGCASQVPNSNKVPVKFEDANHFPYELISEKFKIIDSQVQMDGVFSIIHSKSGGNRLAPIPFVNDTESYLIFKPLLKNSNDIEIKEIYLENDILYVIIQPLDNPQMKSSGRITPNILVKLLQKVSPKIVIIK